MVSSAKVISVKESGLGEAVSRVLLRKKAGRLAKSGAYKRVGSKPGRR